MTGITKEELLAEEHICNGKCQDDITKNYVHCKTCTRLKDFLAGYRTRKAELAKQITELKKENAELKEKVGKYQIGMFDEIEKRDKKLTKAKDHIKQLLDCLKQDTNDSETNYYVCQYMDKAEQFLKETDK